MTIERGCPSCKSIDKSELYMVGGSGEPYHLSSISEFKVELCSSCKTIKDRKEFYEKLGVKNNNTNNEYTGCVVKVPDCGWACGSDEQYSGKIPERRPDFSFRVENEKGQKIIHQSRQKPYYFRLDENDRSISFIIDKLPKEAYCIKVFKDV